MREIISLSCGKESNFAQTHWWNFQDEQLKYLEDRKRSVVNYYETRSSGQLMPRQIYLDFKDNFGNFSSCFALQNQEEAAK